MTETKCERQAEKLGFMAEDVSSLIELAEQVRQDLKDEAVWGKPDYPEELSKKIKEVEVTISALESCLAAINSGRLSGGHLANQDELEAKFFLQMKYGEVDT